MRSGMGCMNVNISAPMPDALSSRMHWWGLSRYSYHSSRRRAVLGHVPVTMISLSSMRTIPAHRVTEQGITSGIPRTPHLEITSRQRPSPATTADERNDSAEVIAFFDQVAHEHVLPEQRKHGKSKRIGRGSDQRCHHRPALIVWRPPAPPRSFEKVHPSKTLRRHRLGHPRLGAPDKTHAFGHHAPEEIDVLASLAALGPEPVGRIIENAAAQQRVSRTRLLPAQPGPGGV